MRRAVKGSRRYDSTRRREQARQNRWAVLQAARKRFLRAGYAATTIGEIAADAGLSVESVYKMFKNKPGLLKAVFDVSVAGDDEPVPIAEREDIQNVIAEPDPARKIELYAEHLSRTMPRVAPIDILIRDASGADPGARKIRRQVQREFLDGMGRFAENLAATGGLRPGLTVEQVRDVLWSFNSSDLFALLVLERRWPPEQYASVVAEAVKGALLP